MMKKIPAENLVLLRRTSMKLRKTRTSAVIFFIIGSYLQFFL